MAPTHKHPLIAAAERLEEQADLRRNRKYRNTYLLAAAHYRAFYAAHKAEAGSSCSDDHEIATGGDNAPTI